MLLLPSVPEGTTEPGTTRQPSWTISSDYLFLPSLFLGNEGYICLHLSATVYKRAKSDIRVSLIPLNEKIVVAQAFLKVNVSLRAEVRVTIQSKSLQIIQCDWIEQNTRPPPSPLNPTPLPLIVILRFILETGWDVECVIVSTSFTREDINSPGEPQGDPKPSPLRERREKTSCSLTSPL